MISESLRKAADFLETHDWCQKAYACNEQGRTTGYKCNDACKFCLVGAFMLANNVTNLELDHIFTTGTINAMIQFNDEPGRTKEEVIAYLRTRAEAIERRPDVQIAQEALLEQDKE